MVSVSGGQTVSGHIPKILIGACTLAGLLVTFSCGDDSPAEPPFAPFEANAIWRIESTDNAFLVGQNTAGTGTTLHTVFADSTRSHELNATATEDSVVIDWTISAPSLEVRYTGTLPWVEDFNAASGPVVGVINDSVTTPTLTLLRL